MTAPPKLLIIGHSGQVGGELRRKLPCLGHLIAVDYPEVDLSSPDSVRGLIRSVSPKVIVNAAAYTAVDKAESDPDRAMAINGVAPGIIAEEAKRLGSILVHYSTDYVFDGAKCGPYTETDHPNPLSVYGRSKLAGDTAVLDVGGSSLVFRTSWVYGARGSNFVLTILRLAQERPELRIVDDQVGAPTSSETIANATFAVLSQLLSPANSGTDARYGLFNLTTRGEVSWCGFAAKILENAQQLLGITAPRLTPIRTEEYPLPARRPSNSRLSTEKLEQAFGIYMPSWEDALSLVMESVAAMRSGPRSEPANR